MGSKIEDFLTVDELLFFLFGTKFVARLFTFSSYILHSFIYREYIQNQR